MFWGLSAYLETAVNDELEIQPAWHRDYNLSQTKTIAKTTVKAYDKSFLPSACMVEARVGPQWILVCMKKSQRPKRWRAERQIVETERQDEADVEVGGVGGDGGAGRVLSAEQETGDEESWRGGGEGRPVEAGCYCQSGEAQ